MVLLFSRAVYAPPGASSRLITMNRDSSPLQVKTCPANQTRRFLGGRQPLCGMAVVSRIDRTSSPAVASARTADSRPEPGPLTRLSLIHISEPTRQAEISYAVFCL